MPSRTSDIQRVFFVRDGLSYTLFIPMMMSAMGSAALAYNALRLPGWALERETQMEQVAARARSLLATAPEPQAQATTPNNLLLTPDSTGEGTGGIAFREAAPSR
jgi:hypothetical protein